MNFRRISAAAAAFSILACCTSCGSSGGSDSTPAASANTTAGTEALTEPETGTEPETTTAPATAEKPTTAPQEVLTAPAVTGKPSELSALSGLYLSPTDTMKISEWYTGDADESIRKGLEQNNSSLLKGDSRTYNPYSLSFNDGEFSMGKNNGKYSIFYSGKVYEQNGRLWFDYENYDAVTSDGSSSDSFSINDPEPEDESKKKKFNAVINNLNELNAEGLYYTRLVPRICTFDKLIQYDYMPFLYASAGTNLPPAELYASGDVLYHKTYGTELNGSYTPGSDFSVSYDQIKVQKEDPNSSYNKKKTQEEKDELLSSIYISNIKTAYGLPEDSGDTSTEITFSGGKWEWKSSAGTLLNNGYYAESKTYPGLVVMGIDETSKNNDSQAKEKYMSDANILLLYITDSGEVTYPVLLKFIT
ncbi:MAG: hypothetical protein IKO47_09050 [Ruminococcus sp.]|nr:hypothetical protein [Ruminococcus sp.]